MSVQIPSGGASDPKCLPGCGSLALALTDDDLTDEQREILIRAHCTVGTFEVDPDRARHAFARMADLIKQRSSQQIARMERDKGLNRA